MIIPHHKGGAVASASKEVKNLLNDLVPPQVYPATIELYRQGSYARDVYFIHRGLVKLVRAEGEGHEVIIDLRLPGWLLGAPTVITKQQHPVTAITLSECVLQRIPAEVFHMLLRTNTHFSMHVHQMHSYEVMDHIIHMAQISCLPAEHRLGALLWQLVQALELNNNSKEILLRLPLKQWEIAQLIAVTPEYLCRLLKRMQREGAVRQEKGFIIIQDVRKLWHSSEEEHAFIDLG